jgi:hypothetical protein
MHGTKLSAALERRHRFARIEQPVFIKYVFDGVEGVQFRGLELDTHLVDFLDPDTMFTGNRAADFDA